MAAWAARSTPLEPRPCNSHGAAHPHEGAPRCCTGGALASRLPGTSWPTERACGPSGPRRRH
eukprot:9585993-Alexandrium_andersonii.AAC.1